MYASADAAGVSLDGTVVVVVVKLLISLVTAVRMNE